MTQFSQHASNQSETGHTSSNNDAVIGIWFKEVNFQAGFTAIQAYANVGVIELFSEEGAKVIPYVESLQFFELLLIFNLDDPNHLAALYSDLQGHKKEEEDSTEDNKRALGKSVNK